MGDSAGQKKSNIIQYRVTPELEEQFMMALRKAQTEGEFPIDGEQQDAMRQLMRAFVNNPEIIRYGATEKEMQDANSDS